MSARLQRLPVRPLVVALLLGVIALCWAWLLAGAGTLEDMGGMAMPMASGPWTPGYMLLMWSMWAVMMAAMMLPAALPVLLLFDTLARQRRARGGSAAPTAAFAAGYLAVWALFSVGAVALQYALQEAALLSSMMESTSRALTGALLLGAGLYQWTPLKQRCLRHCRSPLEFLLAHWREGAGGALRMGAQHGLWCLGCCALLMLLLFAVGVMNLLWVAALAVFVLVEKTAPAGHWLGRAAGVALAAWGLALLASLVR